MKPRGLSLIEVLIAIAIIGLLAVLAVPRFSRAAIEPQIVNPRPALVTLRSAIELYYYDHGAYPGQHSDGINPPGSTEAFCRQLIAFSDGQGHASGNKTEAFRFGPYLRDGIPPCPVPPRIGASGVVATTDAPSFQQSPADAGWVYNCQTGAVCVNSAGMDADGLRYDRY